MDEWKRLIGKANRSFDDQQYMQAKRGYLNCLLLLQSSTHHWLKTDPENFVSAAIVTYLNFSDSCLALQDVVGAAKAYEECYQLLFELAHAEYRSCNLLETSILQAISSEEKKFMSEWMGFVNNNESLLEDKHIHFFEERVNQLSKQSVVVYH